MNDQLRIIRHMVRDKVDCDPKDIPELKNAKNVPAPDKYDGHDDAEYFMSWLKCFLRWLMLNRTVGRAYDDYRTNILGQFLTGAARDWYDEVIDNEQVTGRVWIFVDTIGAMFKRFIHRSTARNAADKFLAAEYTKEGGVNGLWEYMIKWSMKMPSTPDDYTFNRKFVDALPEAIGVPMFQSRNVSVEKTPPLVLKRIALEQEESNRVVEEYRRAHRKQISREHAGNSAKAISNDARPAQSGPMHRDRYTNDNRGRNRPPGRYSRPLNNRSGNGGGLRTFESGRMIQTSTAAQNASSSRPTGTPQVTTSGNTTTATAATGSTRIQCYNCGDYGHIAPRCPKTAVPKLRAARVIHEEDETTGGEAGDDEAIVPPCARGETGDEDPESQPSTHEEPRDDASSYDLLDGSQYESEEDREYYESDYDGQTVSMRMMRRVPFSSHSDSESDTPIDENQPWQDSSDEETEETRNPWQTVQNDFLQDIPRQSRDPRLVEEGRNNSTEGRRESALDDDLYADMPPLMDLSESETETDTTHQRETVTTTRGYTSSRRIPIEEYSDRYEGEMLWDAMLADHNDLAAQGTMYRYWRTLVTTNHYLLDQLDGQRLRAERLRTRLAWTQRELARAIQREADTIDATYQTLIDRTVQLQSARTAIGTREEIYRASMPQSDVRGDIWDADYIDDPSSETAERELETATRAGLPPPAYQSGGPALRAMVAVRAPPATQGNVTTRARIGRRPLVPRLEDTGLTMYMRINGLEAIVLFDSGSTGDSISPEFAKVAQILTFELENPTQLQLGCSGSRSRITHGAQAPLIIGETTVDVYMDVVNLDRYDVVLGTPFMRRLGVILDFGKSQITIQGQTFTALTPLEEDAGATRRQKPRAVGSKPGPKATSPAIRTMRAEASS